MGLDSVELIIELENFFEIVISDKAAGEIGTIQEAADCISTLVKYTDRGINHKVEITKRLVDILSGLSVAALPISTDDKIFYVLPIAEQQNWKTVAGLLNYELPVPFLTGRIGKLVEKIFPSKIKFEET